MALASPGADAEVRRALEAGVAGILRKGASGSEGTEAVTRALRRGLISLR